MYFEVKISPGVAARFVVANRGFCATGSLGPALRSCGRFLCPAVFASPDNGPIRPRKVTREKIAKAATYVAGDRRKAPLSPRERRGSRVLCQRALWRIS